ncbi:hypothetical protein AVEN_28937-1 [Araneus ventricosus]|uniref:Uncharacterized protein n=1 Tax=Araneus ventricosus TaxID=182803 RepID=A0A4Y2AKW1_ARAVE|nr:hypothetical protein AVEN_28937-1 [Araneus ventricosus]
MIPENATLFSIFLLGKGIHEKTPCDVTACRREYLITAPRSVWFFIDWDRLGARMPLEFYPQCELHSLLPEKTWDLQDFERVKSLLLKIYKFTVEKFRQLFSKHCKSQTATWKDFAYEVKNYFHGWISGLDIFTFDHLKELIIVDQMKLRVPPEVREHYIDEWSQLNNVEKLISKLEDYGAVLTKRNFHTSTPEEELKIVHTLRSTRRGIQNIIRNSRRNLNLRK